MSKDKQLIMAVERTSLFGDDYFQGFRSAGEVDYESRILSRYRYLKRGEAEEDPCWKQPIGYALIANPETKRVFVYRRSSRDADYPEKRLQGKWSWGVGGHIERTDAATGNPIRESMLREVKEEIGLTGTSQLKVLGYINDDRDAVGKVHFGVLYVIETTSREIKPLSPELAEGKLKTIEKIEKICSSPEFTVEEWSRISLPPLRSYLYNKNTDK